MENKKVLLSVKDLHVKFRVRGRTLSAIRGISLDLYENESLAIVGESGSGKSVFTKTFAGMLDTNGYISEGSIMFNDPELSDTRVRLDGVGKRMINKAYKRLNAFAKLELGAQTYAKMQALKAEKDAKSQLTEEENEALTDRIAQLQFERTELFNQRQTIDSRKEKGRYAETGAQLKAMDAEIVSLRKKQDAIIKERKATAKADSAFLAQYAKDMAALQAQYREDTSGQISQKVKDRNLVLAKEMYLSVGRYGFIKRNQLLNKLLKVAKIAMQKGVDLDDGENRNQLFDQVVFRVQYVGEENGVLIGTCLLNLAKIQYSKDWNQIRGGKIATVFQDPMTSLNPIITIGKQITSVILKHQNCTETEARRRALVLMKKVGIPNAENRFDDYPFQYSGGMRQRIVIAIALSCQPKILICDEPTTALDVTIQAQILKLIKDLQKEYGYSIVFITHDLGVVANVADRVAVLYGGQMVELGTCEEVFYNPQHPYTWALLSSLPQLAQRNTKLYSITGTPPSLYNKIVGDAFAPRNPYCLKVDTLVEPPMFQVSETHFAKTWLLDPRAPKVEKPEIIQNIHEKLLDAFNI